MIVGHLAFANLAKRVFFKEEYYPLLVLASYGPDLVDKTASLLLGMPGRGFGHSGLLFVAAFAVIWGCFKTFGVSRNLLLAGAVMWAAHLAGDFVNPEILFWPLTNPEPGEPFSFFGALHRMYVEFKWPGQLTLEICLVTLALLPMPVIERIGQWTRIHLLRREESAGS